MGWWIALAVLAGLALLPLGVRFRYDADGARLSVLIGCISIQLYPQKKKPKKEKAKKPKKQKKQSPQPQPQPAPKPVEQTLEEKYPNLDKKPGRIPRTPPSQEEPQEGGSWKDFLTLLPIARDFLNSFRRKLRVNRLDLKLILGGSDPCDLAVNYGRTWGAVGGLMPQLERFLVIRKRNVEVECDVTASETKVIARVDLTITLSRILAVTLKYGFRALAEYFKITKKRKGGAA